MENLIIKILIKLGIKDDVKYWIAKLQLSYFNFFSKLGRHQNRNFKNIPIIIISYNQLNYLKQLIEFLQSKKYTNIIIIDNNSTYPPLLEYFDTIPNSVKIYRLEKNDGHLVFWKNEDLFKKYTKGYYVITDPDVVPDNNCPDDFLNYFKNILNKYPTVNKVGFSLKIDDIPEKNQHKQKILNWEHKFWQIKIPSGDFSAKIDTTFALYKPGKLSFKSEKFFMAIRTKLPYLAKHGGWYIDYNNLNSEQSYYLKTANKSASWLINEKGNLNSKVYK